MAAAVGIPSGPANASEDDFDAYEFVSIHNPEGTAALLSGTVVATFTTNARTVRFTAPERVIAESATSRSVRVGVRLRRLPSTAPWAPQMRDEPWFQDWFPSAVQDNVPDLLDYAMRYVTGAPANPPLDGDADYGPLVDGVRQEGADYNDYLQLAVTYPDDPSTSRRQDQATSLDCSGFIRMVLGYRMGWPLKRIGTSPAPALGVPRRAVEMASAAIGAEVIARVGDVIPGAADLSRLAPGDLVFFDADNGDGDAIDHVGIYLGIDDGLVCARPPSVSVHEVVPVGEKALVQRDGKDLLRVFVHPGRKAPA